MSKHVFDDCMMLNIIKIDATTCVISYYITMMGFIYLSMDVIPKIVSYDR